MWAISFTAVAAATGSAGVMPSGEGYLDISCVNRRCREGLVGGTGTFWMVLWFRALALPRHSCWPGSQDSALVLNGGCPRIALRRALADISSIGIR